MASDCHRISLGAAWEPPADPAAPVWVRRFGRPAGVIPGATGIRVFLVVVGTTRGLVLNGVPLDAASAPSAEPPAAGQRHDVTALLGPRNALHLTAFVAGPVAGAAAGHGRVALPEAVGRVWLEVVAEVGPDPA